MHLDFSITAYQRHRKNHRKHRSLRGVVFGCFLAITLFFVLFFTIGDLNPTYSATAAEEEKSIEEALEGEVEKSLDELMTEDLEGYFSELEGSLGGTLGSTFRGLVERILNGEQPLGAAAFLSILAEAFKKNIFAIIASLTTLVILAILYGMCDRLTSGFKNEGTRRIVYFAIYAALISLLAIIVNNLILGTKNVLNGITGLLNAVFPVLMLVLTALGGVSGVAVLQPITLAVSGIVIKIINNAILPMFYATVVFTIIGNLTDNVKLEKLTKAIKSVAGWTLGIMFGVITTLVTVQGMVGASFDSVAVKSAKFALSGYVPLLGGYLSEGFDIVLASGILIKNAIGLSAFLVLLAILLAPLVKILAFSLALKLLAGVLEPVTDPKITNLFYGTASNLNLLLAVCLGVAFLVFIMLMLVIGSFNSGVV